MTLITTDKTTSRINAKPNNDQPTTAALSAMLEAYDCPAILVSSEYEILGFNSLYVARYGEIDLSARAHCFNISHGYNVPCDQAGEACPLKAAELSQHKERVLHVHQTPRGQEHVDVEMLPIFDSNPNLNSNAKLLYFVELLHDIPTVSATDAVGQMVGASEPFSEMLSKIARVSPSQAPVLLLGESGTGKELAAKAIHFGSARKNKPLVTVECSGLTDSLFESELFGHVKGAFTGANSHRVGLIESVKGGTLFLDEIGDVPLSMQVKLLRLLESSTYRPVGSSDIKRADFRLVCATHKNLAHMVQNGQFRRDLYFRINTFPIKLPALKIRLNDIPMLASALLKTISPQKNLVLTDSAVARLKKHHYTGNIRELKNILNRAIILTDTNVINAAIIEECFNMDAAIKEPENNTHHSNNPSEPPTIWVDLKTAEKNYITQLMNAHNHNKEAVAHIAGISLRSLYRKLDENN